MANIPKPSKDVYKEVVNFAELLRETGNDPHAMAHLILYLAERNRKLEDIATTAEEYVQFGQDQQLHSKLLKALERFREYEVEAEQMAAPKFGLD